MQRSARPLPRFALGLMSVIVAGAAWACSLQDGGVVVFEGGDGGPFGGGDATTDAASATDADIADGSGDGTTPLPDAATDAGPPRYLYASTATGIYSLELNSRVLHEVATISGCGITNSFTNADIAVDVGGLVHILTWTPGSYHYYALENDGGCVDVHPGAGALPATTSWVAYQKAAADTLVVDTVGSSAIVNADQNSNYINTYNNVLPTTGATADLTCSPTLCYTALAHDHCSSDAGANDCLFAFTMNGSTAQQIGDFGKAGVVGMAYDSGYVYGFFADGSIYQLSVTPGSTGHAFAYTRSGSPPTWQGAGSSSGNP